MHAWLTRLLPQPTAPAALPRRLARVTVHSCAGAPAAVPATPALPAPQDVAEAGDEGVVPAGCGWFESSHALCQGLAVTEWAEADWAVAALYFLPAAGAAPSSMRLQ